MDRRDYWNNRGGRPQTIVIELEDDDGNCVEHTLPTRWEICGTCEGNGQHVNPGIDAHGLTADDFADDPDFADDYFNHRYDVACYECGGTGKVAVVDDNACDADLLRRYRDEQAALDEMYAIEAAERRMGA